MTFNKYYQETNNQTIHIYLTTEWRLLEYDRIKVTPTSHTMQKEMWPDMQYTIFATVQSVTILKELQSQHNQ